MSLGPAAWRRQVPLPRADLAAAGALAALVALLFRDVVLGRRVLYERDIHAVWTEHVESFVRCVTSGSWPVWDPYVSFGQPMLANPATQALYPSMWMNLLLPPGTAYALHVTAHLLFGGLGSYALARRLGRSRAAALAAAAIWTAAGPVLSLVSVWHHLAGAAWMPWVLMTAEGLFRSPATGRALICGAALAAQVLAGSPDMCMMTAVLALVLCAVALFRHRERGPALRLVRFGLLAVAFALGLSAAMWLPAVENARRSARWEMQEGSRTFWSLHPAQLLQAFLPLLPADLPMDAKARTLLFDREDPFINSVYVGLPALALAAAAFAGPARPWTFGALAVAWSVVALGRHTWGYPVAVALLPPLKMLRYPSKAMVPAALAAAILCAHGFDAWSRDAIRPRSWTLMVVVPALAATAVLWSLTWMAAHPDSWLAPAVGKLLVASIASTATATLAMARLWRPRRARALATAAAMVAAANLVWVHRDLSPTAPPDFYRYRPAVLEVLKDERASRLFVFDYGRVTGKSYSHAVPRDVFVKSPPFALQAAYGAQSYLYPPKGGRWGFFGSFESDLYSLQSAQLRSLTLVLRAAEETPLHPRLLRLGSVDHVLSLHREGLDGLEPVAVLPGAHTPPIHVFRVPDPLPRAYAVSGVRIADGLAAYRTLADPAFDPRGEVILPQGPAGGGAGPAGTARLLDLRHDRVRVAADLERAGYVVVVDAWDPGWRATVDGRPAPVLRANAAFRAVPVEAGRHIVEMVYRPWSILVGAAISTASVILGLGLAAVRLVGR